jgi:flagellar biosynthesis protein FlhA
LALLPDADTSDIVGEAVKEPVYGAPAKWISKAQQEDAAMAGCTVVTPTEILATHLLETLKSNLSRLLSLRALRRILDEFTNLSEATKSEANRRLLDDLIPDKISIDTLLQVLKLLLEERVSIRNLPLILEAIAEGRNTYGTSEGLCEHVRQRLGFQLVSELRRDDGSLPLVQLAPEWENLFVEYQIETAPGVADVALPPDEFNRLAHSISEKLGTANENGFFPAIVTSVKRRRFLQAIMSSKGITAPVLSFEEIARDARPSIVGLVPG